jgi:hypothetical protein
MSNLFNNVSGNAQMEKQSLKSKYSAARINLLGVVLFTLFNILMLVSNSGSYFLFSASVPYMLTEIGMLFCGRFPDEVYTGEFEGMVFADQSLFWGMLIISIIILGVYTLCWFLSRNDNVKPLKAALVLFCIDTGILLLNGGLYAIVDLAFHVWVIYILVMGIKAHKKLQELPDEPIEAEFTALNEDGTPVDSPILRPMDTEVKARVLLDTEIYNYHIVYRRIKKTNELVINGNVYSEYSATMELPHDLRAVVDGHLISAGMDHASHSYISVDGNIVKRKIRWI